MRMRDEPEFVKLIQLEFEFVRKRLRGMAMISRGIVPNLVLSRRAVAKMLSAASQYIADETGEAMLGFIIEDDTPEGLPTIYVLDTISPDETAVRRSHTFQQGDGLQDEIILWLQENWRVHREKYRGTADLSEPFDVPLRYLGDWHKQPGSMIQPSHGDLMTALSWLDDDELGYLLVPIVTVGHAQILGESSNLAVNYILEPMGDGTDMRVDWWYIHRDVRVFQPVHPQVVAEDELPEMMKYSWHVVLADRLTNEILAMEDDGLLVKGPVLYECDGEVPLEYCFITIRQGSSFFLLLVTQHDYPASAPTAYRAPFTSGEDLMDPVAAFDKLWQLAAPVDDPEGWEWSSDKYLIDYVIAIEVDMGLRQPPKVIVPIVADEDDDAIDDARNEVSADSVLEADGLEEARHRLAGSPVANPEDTKGEAS